VTATLDSRGPALLDEARRQLDNSVARIKHCLDQLDDEQLWWRPKPDMNSIANLILHLCGNVGQWIIAGLSGAPDTRNRPQEFTERSGLPKAALPCRVPTLAKRAVIR
jgi:hypothetical protein